MAFIRALSTKILLFTLYFLGVFNGYKTVTFSLTGVDFFSV